MKIEKTSNICRALILLLIAQVAFVGCGGEEASEEPEPQVEFISSIVEVDRKMIKTDQIEYHLEPLLFENGQLIIEGWAYPANEPDTEETMLYMVLQREDQHTFFTTEAIDPQKAAIRFGLEDDSVAANSAFRAKIPDTLYDEYLYQIGLYAETEIDASLTHSGTFISDRQVYQPALSNVIFAGDQAEGRVVYLTAEPQIEKGMVVISGWAYLSGHDTKELEHYIYFSKGDETILFSAESFATEDVTMHFNRSGLDLNKSGFRAELPLAMVEPASDQLGLYLVHPEIVGVTETKTRLHHREPYISSPIELPPATVNYSSTVVNWIDEYNDEGDYIYVRGWAFLQGKDNSEPEHYLILRKSGEIKIFTVERQIRTDVTEYFVDFPNLDADNSGFVARIPKDLLEPGNYQVGVFTQTDSARGLFYSDYSFTKE